MDTKNRGYLPTQLQAPGLWDLIKDYSGDNKLQRKYELAMNRKDFTEAAILALQDPEGKLDIYKVLEEEKKNNNYDYLEITWDKVLPTAIYTDNKEMINYAERHIISDYNLAMIAAVIKKNTVLANRYIEYGANDWDMGLQIAAQHGDISAINFFKSKGADIPDYGLMGAAEGGHLNLVKQFISEGAVNFKIAFLKAAKGGQYEIMKYFHKEYPGIESIETDLAIYAGYTGNKDIVKFYLKNLQHNYNPFLFLSIGYAKAGDEKNAQYFSDMGNHGDRYQIYLIGSGAKNPVELKESSNDSNIEQMMIENQVSFTALEFYSSDQKENEDVFIWCMNSACRLDNLNLIKFLEYKYSELFRKYFKEVYYTALGCGARSILGHLKLNLPIDTDNVELIIGALERYNLRLVQTYPEILSAGDYWENFGDNTFFDKLIYENEYEDDMDMLCTDISSCDYFIKNNILTYDPAKLQNYSFPKIFCFCKYGKVSVMDAVRSTNSIKNDTKNIGIISRFFDY